MKEEYQQIFIKYYSEVLERDTEEILWAITVNTEKNLFMLDSIPFYGAELSCEDIVSAKWNQDTQLFDFQHIETVSGNTTVQVIVQKDNYNREDLYNEILLSNTEIEVVDDYYFVINVPQKTDYKNVYAILSALEDEKVISFAEPNLSAKHSADLR